MVVSVMEPTLLVGVDFVGSFALFRYILDPIGGTRAVLVTV